MRSLVLRGDHGSIAPAVPVFAVILLLLGGLVIDASRLLNARGRAVAYAEEAARAGASAVRAGSTTLGLDEAAARARVRGFCDSLLGDAALGGGVQECRFVAVEAVGDGDGRRLVVRVFVRLQIAASLLGLVGVQTLDASGQARARAFEGVDPRDVDSPPPPVEVPDPVTPLEPPPPIEIDPPEPPLCELPPVELPPVELPPVELPPVELPPGQPPCVPPPPTEPPVEPPGDLPPSEGPAP